MRERRFIGDCKSLNVHHCGSDEVVATHNGLQKRVKWAGNNVTSMCLTSSDRSPDSWILLIQNRIYFWRTRPAYLHHFVFTIINADHHTEDWTFMLPVTSCCTHTSI